jgi:type IV pilus assembly protein PilE
MNKDSGVTLIELMITVAIIAILASVAYPSYTQYIVDTRRKLAQACLTEYSLYMERYYTQNLTYASAALSAGECVNTLNRSATYYNFALSNLSASAYTLTASPVGAQASNDAKCGVALTLNQSGTRGVGSGGVISKCW